MSLLMDALRKAEEAKKQAENADTPEQVQEQTEQQAADQPSTAPPIQEPPAEESAVEAPASESEPEVSIDIEGSAEDSETDVKPPIPDVEIEFQQEQESPAAGDEIESENSALEEAGAEDAAETTNSEAAADEFGQGSEGSYGGKKSNESSSEPLGLSLEPIDAGLSGVTRKDFSADATPDYSQETPRPIANSAYSADATTASESVHDTEKDSGIHYGGEPQYQPPAAEPITRQQPLASDSVAAVESEPVRSEPPVNQVRTKTAPNPSLRAEPDPNSISARSEPARRSAKAVFAAKKQGKKTRRFRIRRSTRIWAAQIAAVLLLVTGGSYYYFSTSGNSNSFNVPAEYLANQDSYSNNFNDELAALDESNAAEEAVPEVLSGLSEITPTAPESAEQVSEEALESESAIEQAADSVESIVSADTAEETIEPIASSAVEVEVTVTETADAEETTTSATTLSNVTTSDAPTSVVQTLQPSRPEQPADGTISFSRAQARTDTDPLLQDAFAAYQRDELSRARELYQQVLIQSPLQRDALLGLAAIATRDNDTSLAMELYSRLLARDPNDGIARAGLLGIRPVGGAETQERELRRLREEHPEVAPVAYALGNFYAVQNRWNEAQRFYFNALQLAKANALAGVPVNPDYAFNLAVSLERLNQSSAAETYYREAIAFAEDFPAGFDISVARSRLRSIAGANS